MTNLANRRQFLKSSSRYLLLSGFTGLVVTSEAKRRRLANDPNCIRLLTCSDCIEFGGCTKNKANTYREHNSAAVPKQKPRARHLGNHAS